MARGSRGYGPRCATSVLADDQDCLSKLPMKPHVKDSADKMA